jgi:hypothetical protein
MLDMLWVLLRVYGCIGLLCFSAQRAYQLWTHTEPRDQPTFVRHMLFYFLYILWWAALWPFALTMFGYRRFTR